jgi:hypothetical protein
MSGRRAARLPPEFTHRRHVLARVRPAQDHHSDSRMGFRHAVT